HRVAPAAVGAAAGHVGGGTGHVHRLAAGAVAAERPLDEEQCGVAAPVDLADLGAHAQSQRDQVGEGPDALLAGHRHPRGGDHDRFGVVEQAQPRGVPGVEELDGRVDEQGGVLAERRGVGGVVMSFGSNRHDPHSLSYKLFSQWGPAPRFDLRAARRPTIACMDDMDGPEPLMSIGAFARRVGLAPSALRFYDDAGMLHPALVDAGTGYRYYSVDQESRAVLLRRLRGTGMPLTDAAVVLDGPREEARAVLEAHAARAEEAAEAARAAVAEILRDLQGTAATRAVVGGAELAGAVRQVVPSTASGPAR